MSNHNLKPIQIPLPLDELTVEIPLTKGYVAIVDAVDADLLVFKWGTTISHNTRVYATRLKRENGVCTSIFLHKVILERALNISLTDDQVVDHIDNNPLNDRRENLRPATNISNGQNRKVNSNSVSGFKGVTWRAGRNRWLARITVNKRTVYLGLFKNPEDAYKAYCDAATKYFGEFARFK